MNEKLDELATEIDDAVLNTEESMRILAICHGKRLIG